MKGNEMEQQMIVTDEVKQALSVAGWDLEKELDDMTVISSQLELPRVRIEHKENGHHRMYLDKGESYLDSESQEIDIRGNKLTAVVFAEQFIRAYWQNGEEVPVCSAIDDIPISDNPIAVSCKQCEFGVIGGECKPKIRLLMLLEIDGEAQPLIMNLSPTSIKHWNTHKRKLTRSNLPVVAVKTTFEIEDIRKNGYRWAEVKLGMDGISSKEVLILAKAARTELDKFTDQISHRDFEDAGDKF
jgi:hypothetical protein